MAITINVVSNGVVITETGMKDIVIMNKSNISVVGTINDAGTHVELVGPNVDLKIQANQVTDIGPHSSGYPFTAQFILDALNEHIF